MNGYEWWICYSFKIKIESAAAADNEHDIMTITINGDVRWIRCSYKIKNGAAAAAADEDDEDHDDDKNDYVAADAMKLWTLSATTADGDSLWLLW